MKFYDKKNVRLVCAGDNSATFWDKQWNYDDFAKTLKIYGEKNSFVTSVTKKYLPSGSRVLEGGCGMGHYVYSLERVGYESHGIDNAPKVIKKINTIFPDLKISNQDVRKTDFEDNFFDGYWSLGVIEHFVDGYDDVLFEMNRIVRSGGFLFVTFPYMSRYRRLKARLGFYDNFEKNISASFYQYILKDEIVIKKFSQIGFELVEKKPMDAVRGLSEEFYSIDFINSSPVLVAKIIRYAVNRLLSFYFGHIVLLVFKKK